MTEKQYLTNSEEETRSLGKKFAKNLHPGDIFAIWGDLGAGKTTFIQGIAAGLGYKKRVLSPTFIFVRPYNIDSEKIKTLNHIDMYRIEKSGDLKSLGIEEFLNDPQAVSVIEWPERINKLLPESTKRIYLEKVDENTRKIKLISTL